MEKLLASEIFKPGAFPEYTYISRKSPDLGYTYEVRLKQALNTVGYLTSIIGASKTGKTVLCEKVIGQDNIVSLTGNDFKNANDFWEIIAQKANLPFSGEQTEIQSFQDNNQSRAESRTVEVRERYKSSKDKVIEYFKTMKYVLVLDDFHYAPKDLQYDIAYQLKDAIRKEFKAVIISLPHRADDAIRKNPDLSGRLNLINIEPWKEDELREIAVTGFEKLGINLSGSDAEKIARESLTSPQLMQSICLNICILLNIDEESVTDKEIMKSLIQCYEFTTLNLPYQEVVSKLKNGPSTRGQKRKEYKLKNEESRDVYSIILKAISEDPPIISIPLDDIKNRVDKLLKDKLEKNKIRESLAKLQDIIVDSEPIYQVFEWKDNKVYILDPLFLFYLRWGKHSIRTYKK